MEGRSQIDPAEVAQLDVEQLTAHSREVWQRFKSQIPDEVKEELGPVLGTMTERLEYAATGQPSSSAREFTA